MKTVKVFLADGNSFITYINGTEREIRQYYCEGAMLNIGTVEDDIQVVTMVKILK